MGKITVKENSAYYNRSARSMVCSSVGNRHFCTFVGDGGHDDDGKSAKNAQKIPLQTVYMILPLFPLLWITFLVFGLLTRNECLIFWWAVGKVLVKTNVIYKSTQIIVGLVEIANAIVIILTFILNKGDGGLGWYIAFSALLVAACAFSVYEAYMAFRCACVFRFHVLFSGSGSAIPSRGAARAARKRRKKCRRRRRSLWTSRNRR